MILPSPNLVRQFRIEALNVRVYGTPADLARAAAQEAAGILQEALRRQRNAAAILASAASQVAFLDALTQLPGIEWSRITLFHMDEYLGMRADHPASFRRFLREQVEERVHPKTFHYLGGDAPEPLKECERYTRLLRAQPLDLCCLGIGENGHLAFNDPPVADFRDPSFVKIVQLDEDCRRQQVGEGAFPALDAVPQYAYTLTLTALRGSRRTVGVVPERRKAPAVKRALHGTVATECPASVLQVQPQATLFLDTDSASLL